MFDRLLPFLDIVALELTQDNAFHVVVPFPSWFLQFYPEAGAAGITINPEEQFSFLGDFLIRAADFWKTGSEGSIVSGAWVETDVSGKDRMLQATAISVSGRKLLLVEPARVPLEEAQLLLQRGRQTSLDFRTVKRKQRSLRKVQQRYLALLDAVPDWVFVVQQDGSILEYSSGREELFESMEPETGKNISDVLPADLATQLIPQIEIVISSGKPQLGKYRRAEGSVEVLILATGQDEAMCILRKR
jgi:PAS domain-containing protein